MLVSIHYCLISHLITSEHTSMSKYSLPAYELRSNESLHRFIDSLIHSTIGFVRSFLAANTNSYM